MSQPFAYLQMPWSLGSGVTPSLAVSPRKVIVVNATQSLQVVMVARDDHGVPIPDSPMPMIDLSSDWASLVSSQATSALQALINLGDTTKPITGQDFTNATIATSPTTCLMMMWMFGAGVCIERPVVIRGAVVNMDEQQFLLQFGPIDDNGAYIGSGLQIDIGPTNFIPFAGSQVVPVLNTILSLGLPEYSEAVLNQVSA